MAPLFGASTIVWANTIGIVLVALSVGYWLGGGSVTATASARPLHAGARRCPPPRRRPVRRAAVLRVSVDALDRVCAGAFVGSLVAVLTLVAVPVILLGACFPYAIRLAVPDVEHWGHIAGRLYAVSTAGSLLGTMLAALVLIPFAGTQRTFLAFALALVWIVGAAGLGWRSSPFPPRSSAS